MRQRTRVSPRRLRCPHTVESTINLCTGDSILWDIPAPHRLAQVQLVAMRTLSVQTVRTAQGYMTYDSCSSIAGRGPAAWQAQLRYVEALGCHEGQGPVYEAFAVRVTLRPTTGTAWWEELSPDLI